MEKVDSARLFQDKIISNHLVTDQIFCYLNKSELLECSLISKKWISPCRKFLHDHHECLLRLNAGTRESVLVTSKLLDDCNYIFYNGIFWNFSKISTRDHTGYVYGNRGMWKDIKKQVDGSILKRLPNIKFLTLHAEDWEYVYYNPNSVRKYCPMDLTEIEKLKIFGGITPDAFDVFFGQRGFPSLKVACIPEEFNDEGEDFIEILQRVLSLSPVLQEWSSEINDLHIQIFAQANKLALIKTIEIQNGIEPEDIDAIETGNVALRRLHFLLGPTAENVEIFRRITVASTTSLQKLELGYEFCRMLIITPGIRPLINVKELFFVYLFDPYSFDEVKAEMEADGNAQQIFPNANVVRRISSD